jgi:glutamine synthetase
MALEELTPHAAYVLRTVEERGIRFVRLWFVDVLGLLKSTAIPVSELEQALEEGVGLDGSAIESRARLSERDVIAHPDPTTLEVLPWRKGGGVARMFCDIKLPDGTPFPGDCREALRRQLARAAELGYSFQVGPEIEFFLFDEPEGDAGAEPRPLDEGSYFDLTAQDAGSDFRRRTIETMEQMGVPVKASHHEVAASQHEIDLKHTDALSMADAIVTFRLAVKEVARELGIYATFMPKPLDRLPGSGMHLHLSLTDLETERNVFYAEGDDPLSETGRDFLAGILAHAPELTALTNQWVNSYKRLATGFEAPQAICWTRQANGALVRFPSNRPGKESAARIELRSPDPACNPYLVFALVLAAGLDGIQRRTELPAEAASDNLEGYPRLPEDLGEATDRFEASELAREILGERLCEWFVANKRHEWSEYQATVTEYERRRYLRLL